MNGHTARICAEFNKELEDIIKKRVEKGTDKKKKSKKKLTNLIIKHIRWKEMKHDLMDINLEDKNRR